MQNINIGALIYFWIFVLGGLFAAKIFGFADNTRLLIITMLAIIVVYLGFMYLKNKTRSK